MVEAPLWRELAALAERFAQAAESAPVPASVPAPPVERTSWRELLWTAPAAARLNVRDLAEALGQSTSWVYKHTASSANPIPHRRLAGGKLQFLAGEVRAWVQQQEAMRQSGTSETAAERFLERATRRRARQSLTLDRG